MDRKNFLFNLRKGARLIFLLLGLFSSCALGGAKSMANNTGATDMQGYLLMKVEHWNPSSETWELVETVVNDTSPRKVRTHQFLALDIIWAAAGSWNTSGNIEGGTYRVYVALRDPEGNTLKSEDGSEMSASYNFTVDLGPPQLTFKKPSPDNSTLVAKWFKQNISVADVALNQLNCTIYNSSYDAVWSKEWNLTGLTKFEVDEIINVSTWSYGIYYENCTVTDA